MSKLQTSRRWRNRRGYPLCISEFRNHGSIWIARFDRGLRVSAHDVTHSQQPNEFVSIFAIDNCELSDPRLVHADSCSHQGVFGRAA